MKLHTISFTIISLAMIAGAIILIVNGNGDAVFWSVIAWVAFGPDEITIYDGSTKE
jgi:hypothetical protein